MQLTLFFAYVFLIITFGFSALEKLWRWKSSVAYYQDYFKKTLLQKGMLFTLSAIVFIELVISIFLIIGCYEVICQKHLTFGFFGVVFRVGVIALFSHRATFGKRL